MVSREITSLYPIEMAKFRAPPPPSVSELKELLPDHSRSAEMNKVQPASRSIHPSTGDDERRDGQGGAGEYAAATGTAPVQDEGGEAVTPVQEEEGGAVTQFRAAPDELPVQLEAVITSLSPHARRFPNSVWSPDGGLFSPTTPPDVADTPQTSQRWRLPSQGATS